MQRSEARSPEEKAKVRKEAERTVARMRERKVIGGCVQLNMDSGDIIDARQIFLDPDRWNEATLADPGEPEYGRGKAKVYVNGPGDVVIHSLAQGLSVSWRVTPDVETLEALLERSWDDPAAGASYIAQVLGWAQLDEIVTSDSSTGLPG